MHARQCLLFTKRDVSRFCQNTGGVRAVAICCIRVLITRRRCDILRSRIDRLVDVDALWLRPLCIGCVHWCVLVMVGGARVFVGGNNVWAIMHETDCAAEYFPAGQEQMKYHVLSVYSWMIYSMLGWISWPPPKFGTTDVLYWAERCP